MKIANVYCYYLLVSFGILSVAYALKLAVVHQMWLGSALFFLHAILCMWLLNASNKLICHRQLCVVMIIFFTVSVTSGYLQNIGRVVVAICMLYLLVDAICRDRNQSG